MFFLTRCLVLAIPQRAYIKEKAYTSCTVIQTFSCLLDDAKVCTIFQVNSLFIYLNNRKSTISEPIRTNKNRQEPIARTIQNHKWCKTRKSGNNHFTGSNHCRLTCVRIIKDVR